jgi:hypothetical protein
MEVDGDKETTGLEDVGGRADGVVDGKIVSEERCVTVVGGWVWLVGGGRYGDLRNENMCSLNRTRWEM